jgi:two-component system cell cycle sensor histidine kinase/response regulator CckA
MADSLGERQVTVLVVEDTEVLLELVVRVLKWAKFEVLQAASGSDALKVAAAYPAKIDLLLSDVRLPGLSGPKVAELLKHSRPEMQVVLMSAFIGGEQLAAIYGWTFIQKPFMAKALLEVINSVLRRTLVVGV